MFNMFKKQLPKIYRHSKVKRRSGSMRYLFPIDDYRYRMFMEIDRSQTPIALIIKADGTESHIHRLRDGRVGIFDHNRSIIQRTSERPSDLASFLKEVKLVLEGKKTLHFEM